MTIPKNVEKQSTKRPPLSPLATYWATHPGTIDMACGDATASIEQARAMKSELDAVARGAIDPNGPGLRMAWAYLGMGGAHRLLDEQRDWHERYFGSKR